LLKKGLMLPYTTNSGGKAQIIWNFWICSTWAFI
jgi:hypothetical protein